MTCAAIGYLCVEYEKDTHAIETRRKACGTCPSGQTCNILEEPPRCTADPGDDGVACGSFEGDKHEYVCGEAFWCSRATKPWRCRALAKTGEPCKTQRDCVEGLGRSWKDHVCIEPHAEGERCHFADDYADDTYEPCAKGLVCNDAERPPHCRAPAQQGEPCRRNYDCAIGLNCDSDAGELGTCTP